jgi:hypothetical protein
MNTVHTQTLTKMHSVIRTNLIRNPIDLVVSFRFATGYMSNEEYVLVTPEL